MNHRLKNLVIWLTISVLGGALVAYFSALDFWVCTLLVGLALTANGIVAYREDKGTFND
jgi:uncharacterized membrane protein HdeD (DUF308 family)